MSTLHERLVGVLSEWSAVAPESITADSDLEAGLDIDSLSRLEFALAVRKEFGVVVSDDEIFAARTVADVHDLIAGHVAND